MLLVTAGYSEVDLRLPGDERDTGHEQEVIAIAQHVSVNDFRVHQALFEQKYFRRE